MTEENKALVDWEAQLASKRDKVRDMIEVDARRVNIRNGMFITPDEQEGEELRVVIIGFISRNMFYDRPFVRGEIHPPACFAIGPNPRALVPSDNSPDKQSESCHICPMNEFGSALQGAGKACKNSRLLAFVPAGLPDAPIWTLNIPAASIKAWDKYVSKLSSEHGIYPTQAVTLIRQDPNQQYAAPRFELEGLVDKSELSRYGVRMEEADKVITAEPNVEDYEPPKRAKK